MGLSWFAGDAQDAQKQEQEGEKTPGWWARAELAASLRPINPYDEIWGRDPDKIAQALRERAVSLGRNGGLDEANWKKAGLDDPETLAMAGLDEAGLRKLSEASMALPSSRTPPILVAAGMTLAGLALLKIAPGGALAFLNHNPWDKVTHFAMGAAIGFCASDPDLGGGPLLAAAAGTAVGIGKEMLDLNFDPLDAAATIAGAAAGIGARKLVGDRFTCDPDKWGLTPEEKAKARLPNPNTGDVARAAAKGILPELYASKIADAPLPTVEEDSPRIQENPVLEAPRLRTLSEWRSERSAEISGSLEWPAALSRLSSG